MLIDKVYSAVSLLVNKDQVSGYLPPDEFNKYAELAQREHIEDNYNPPNKLGYEATFENSDDLSDLKTATSVLVSSGRATIPSDYLHYSSCYANTVFNGKGYTTPIELVRDDEWPERLASQINTPDQFFPIMKQMSTYFEVYPSDSTSNINLTYLKLPLEPWWNYTLSGSTPVFAETGGSTTNPNAGVTAGDSTDFTVGDGAFNSLVWRICSYFGVETQQLETYQISKGEIDG
jgi:hypothetical protein